MYKKLGFIPLSLALVATLSVGATNVLATDETTNENDEEMTEVVDQGNNNQDEVSQKENSNIENSKSMDNQEDSVDIEQQSQAVGIDVENFGFPSRSGSHTLSVGTTTLPYETVYFVDANGNKVANEDGITEVPLTLDMVSGFDSSSVGNREVTVNYGGFSKTIELTFIRMGFTLEGTVPVGADLDKYGLILTEFDVDNGQVYGRGGPISYKSESFVGQKASDLIDSSKSGVQQFTVSYRDHFGAVNSGTLIVKVGSTTSGDVNDLFPEDAVINLPKGEFVGSWTAPITGGQWVFNTSLQKGTGVDVYQFMNSRWVLFGSYNTDSDGNVTVPFSDDQLNPIIMVKNGKDIVLDDSKKDNQTNSSNPNTSKDNQEDNGNASSSDKSSQMNDKKQTEDKSTNNSKKDDKSVNTGVNESLSVLSTLLGTSLIGMLGLIILKKYKELKNF